MADQIVTDLGAIPAFADGDVLYIVDASDPTDNAAGSSKKATLSNTLGHYNSLAATMSNKTVTGLKINDTSADHTYTIGVSELAADRTITLPLLTGNDTFMVLGLAQTVTAVKTFNADVYLGATQKLYLDGGSDTYIHEVSSNVVEIVVGSEAVLSIKDAVPAFINPNGGETLKIRSGLSTVGSSLANIYFEAADSGSNNTEYARLEMRPESNTDGSERGRLMMRVIENGSQVIYFDARSSQTRVNITNADFSIPTTKKIFLDSGGNTYLHEQSADDVEIVVGGEIGLKLEEIGTEINVVCGAANVLAQSATNGYLYIPSYSGTGAPSGTPTSYTGKIAIVYNTNENRIYAYNGSWRSVLFA